MFSIIIFYLNEILIFLILLIFRTFILSFFINFWKPLCWPYRSSNLTFFQILFLLKLFSDGKGMFLYDFQQALDQWYWIRWFGKGKLVLPFNVLTIFQFVWFSRQWVFIFMWKFFHPKSLWQDQSKHFRLWLIIVNLNLLFLF